MLSTYLISVVPAHVKSPSSPAQPLPLLVQGQHWCGQTTATKGVVSWLCVCCFTVLHPRCLWFRFEAGDALDVISVGLIRGFPSGTPPIVTQLRDAKSLGPSLPPTNNLQRSCDRWRVRWFKDNPCKPLNQSQRYEHAEMQNWEGLCVVGKSEVTDQILVYCSMENAWFVAWQILDKCR